MATREKARPRAIIVTPDGKEHDVYFHCAKCGRAFIWSIEDNGRCPKCYHDSFKIVWADRLHQAS